MQHLASSSRQKRVFPSILSPHFNRRIQTENKQTFFDCLQLSLIELAFDQSFVSMGPSGSILRSENAHRHGGVGAGLRDDTEELLEDFVLRQRLSGLVLDWNLKELRKSTRGKQ